MTSNRWLYTIRGRFTPAHREDWWQYIEWRGFMHINELITLDTILCPDRIEDLIPEDWNHNIQADFRLTWFTDLDYLRQRGPSRPGQDQLIAAIENPSDKFSPAAGFTHCGFDILDGEGSISVLTNCGRFPSLFEATDVNRWGLIDALEVAGAIAHQIRMDFPDDPHCQHCQVWQVARDIKCNMFCTPTPLASGCCRTNDDALC